MGNRGLLLVVAVAKSAVFHGHFVDVQDDHGRDHDTITIEIATVHTVGSQKSQHIFSIMRNEVRDTNVTLCGAQPKCGLG